MSTGFIKSWMTANGFGFIKPDDDGPDVFVHVSRVAGRRDLFCGDKVQFERGTNPRSGKPEARDVRLIDEG